MSNYLNEIIIAIVTGAVSFATGFKMTSAQVKAKNAETQNTELDSVDRAIAIWRKLAEDLSQEMTDQKKEFDAQIEQLKQQIVALQRENQKLHDIINDLQKSKS